MDVQERLMPTSEQVTVVKSDGKKKKPFLRMEGPDGCYAWGVAFAAFLINFIMAGLGRMAGILYVAFIDMYGVSRKGATAPFSIRSSTRNLLGPVVGILGQQYGVRAVTFTGGIIGSVSAALCYFADDMYWITVLWGGVNGLGTSFTTTLPQVTIGQYFKKYRTTASGLAFSGGCIGAFLFPVLLEHLIQQYGLQGTFLIMAGIIMHVIPAALILREPPWLRKRINNNTSQTNLQNIAEEVGKTIEKDCNYNKYKETSINEIKPFEKSVANGGESVSIGHIVKDSSVTSVATAKQTLNINREDSGIFKWFHQDKSFIVDVLVNISNIIKDNPEAFLKTETKFNTLSQSEIKTSTTQVINEIYEAAMREKSIQDYEKRTNCGRISKTSMSSIFSIPVSREHEVRRRSRKLSCSSVKSATTKIENTEKQSLEIVKDFLFQVLSMLSDSLSLEDFIETTEYQKHFQTNCSDLLEVLNELCIAYKYYKNAELREMNCHEQVQSSGIFNSLDAYNVDIELHTSASMIVSEVEGGQENDTIPSCKKNDGFLEHIKTALKLNLNPIFHLICFCRAIHFITFVPTVTVIVDFAMDKGFLEEHGKYIIGALSLGDLAGRLGLGWITDRNFMSLPKYMLIVMVFQGATTATLPLCNTMETFIPMIAMFGMLQGSVFIRHPVLVSKYMAPHEQSIAMGCINFLSGFLGFGMPSYIGYFRDTRGSYNEMFYITGALGSFVGLIWILEPYFAKFASITEDEEDDIP